MGWLPSSRSLQLRPASDEASNVDKVDISIRTRRPAKMAFCYASAL
jgi:hypothetical protein